MDEFYVIAKEIIELVLAKIKKKLALAECMNFR
jgi:hypothetical protein